MKPHQIVVTGATGFTGRFVVPMLVQRFPDARVRCFVRSTSVTGWPRNSAIEVVTGDLRDRDSLRRALAGADTLVNLASLGFDWIDPLFEAVRSSTLSRGVFVGTTSMLTALPVKSKAIRERGEALVQSSGLQWTIVRPTMIYGTPEDRNISRLIRFIVASPIIPLIAPHALQQPIHVEDVAAAVVDALDSEATVGHAYNIAGREPHTLEELVRIIIRAANLRRWILKLPVAPVRLAASVYGALSAKPLLKVEQIDRLHEDKSFSYAEASRDFGFAPRSFAAGVAAELSMLKPEHPSGAGAQ